MEWLILGRRLPIRFAEQNGIILSDVPRPVFDAIYFEEAIIWNTKAGSSQAGF